MRLRKKSSVAGQANIGKTPRNQRESESNWGKLYPKKSMAYE
jgi:hypothetical protein